jgi:hypothetical protein
MNMTDLQSLRAMMEAATPGPWKIHDRAGTTVLASDGYSATNTESNLFDSHARNSANAALIVAAINALPRLLSIAEAYEASHAAPEGDKGDAEELLDAARTYWTRYCQDEASDDGEHVTGCSRQQHIDARWLGEAIAMFDAARSAVQPIPTREAGE